MNSGVSKRINKKGRVFFRSSFTFRSKHISLGSFETAQNAHSAYLDALSLVSSDSSLDIGDYDGEKHTVSFEKWVTVINFRDNGLYIKTPIYLRRKYFDYYLSPTEVMKFDADDLFYYSHHKIMRRGGHFFVSDFGMQVNLPSRYGIRSFAVAGRDYFFLNGDPLDFRYGNLKIVNRYFGVRLEKELPKKIYLASIHVNGIIIIGRYEDELKAAVAYNKAADLIEQTGFKRKYERNYIDDLSENEYLNIYKSVKFKKGFLNLVFSSSDQVKSRQE